MSRLETESLDLAEHANVSAATRVYHSLRRRIATLELAPKTILIRADLAEEYGVSMTPIREAMQRLENDGLLDIFPHAKTCVTQIDSAQLNEAYFLRLALESEAVRRLASQDSRAVIERLRAIIRMQEALADDPSVFQMFAEMDQNFHKAIFEGIDQAGQFALIKAKSGNIARARQLYQNKGERTQGVVADHTAIVDAIEAKEQEAAQTLIRKHLSATVSRIEELRKEYPDYFA